MPAAAPALSPASAAPTKIAHQLRATSLNRALLVLGDWWTVMLIREAFVGVRLFDDFQARLAIPRQTLANRLRELVEQDLLYTKPYQARPVRHEYRLSAKGLDLYSYALLLWRWQRRWGQGGANPLPEKLIHKSCGQSFEPVFGCAACREPVTIHEVSWQQRPGLPPAAAERANSSAAATASARATRHTVSRSVLDSTRLHLHGASIVADRWTHLLLAAAYLGVTTFDAFERELGIAPNTLAQRLGMLVDARLLAKQADAQDSRRFQYRLTDRSRDLFPISMALIRWADHWLPSREGPPMLRLHRGCGQPLHGVVMCSVCAQDLKPWDVRFESGQP